jgi:hypothetical protein
MSSSASNLSASCQLAARPLIRKRRDGCAVLPDEDKCAVQPGLHRSAEPNGQAVSALR